jgi:hypothetical protein
VPGPKTRRSRRFSGIDGQNISESSARRLAGFSRCEFVVCGAPSEHQNELPEAPQSNRSRRALPVRIRVEVICSVRTQSMHSTPTRAMNMRRFARQALLRDVLWPSANSFEPRRLSNERYSYRFKGGRTIGRAATEISGNTVNECKSRPSTLCMLYPVRTATTPLSRFARSGMPDFRAICCRPASQVVSVHE